jgi:hypothetical protein
MGRDDSKTFTVMVSNGCDIVGLWDDSVMIWDDSVKYSREFGSCAMYPLLPISLTNP